MKKLFLAATTCCLFVGFAKGQNMLRLEGMDVSAGTTGRALELGFEKINGIGVIDVWNRNVTPIVRLPLDLNGSFIRTNARLLVNGGTDNGQDALQVNGKVRIKNAIEGNNIFVNGCHLELENTAPGMTGGMALTIGKANSGTIQIYSGGTSSALNGDLLLNPSGGKIGIGTSAPTQKLTINGGGIGFDWNSSNKKLYSPVDGTLEWMTDNTASDHGFAVSHQGDRRIYLNTGGNSYIMGGNVGIGTKNPTTALAVAGTILANKVKVSTLAADWPDFVFADDYQLPAIQDVESYIHQHKHLPAIPSAQEVAQQDHDLGEMNKKLLQKVEELTLYIIQQQKQLADMDARLKAVEKQ